MDAFGFGGDSDAEDAPAAAADAPDGEILYADEMQKHLTSILHGMVAAAPADPYKEMYKGCFAASLLEGGGEVTASTMTLTPEHEAYIKKFSLQTHIDTCNAKRTAEMEASGKKVSGGLHKFDASEVDQNGGNATADDFMDAFGFGGDSDAEDAPAAAADAPDGEIVYADEMQKPLTSILHGMLAAAPADP